MELTESQEDDIRGSRWLFQNNDKIITLFEIKKGFARGGQYHKGEVKHLIISGKVEYHKKNINTKVETSEIILPPQVTTLPPYNSDLIIGLEDTIMIGIYPNEKQKMFFEEHRKEVIKRVNDKKTGNLLKNENL